MFFLSKLLVAIFIRDETITGLTMVKFPALRITISHFNYHKKRGQLPCFQKLPC